MQYNYTAITNHPEYDARFVSQAIRDPSQGIHAEPVGLNSVRIVSDHELDTAHFLSCDRMLESMSKVDNLWAVLPQEFHLIDATGPVMPEVTLADYLMAMAFVAVTEHPNGEHLDDLDLERLYEMGSDPMDSKWLEYKDALDITYVALAHKITTTYIREHGVNL